MQNTLKKIKYNYEKSITTDGENTKNTIRTQKIIKILHDKIKMDIINDYRNIDYSLIRPIPFEKIYIERLIKDLLNIDYNLDEINLEDLQTQKERKNNLYKKIKNKINKKKKNVLKRINKESICNIKKSKIKKLLNKKYSADTLGKISNKLDPYFSEVKICGKLKTKKQDITIFPPNNNPKREVLNSYSLVNIEDLLGTEFTEKIITINIRSQLSSTGKNFDTMYERIFAEPLNLHLRCPKMVLGEVYLISINEYDDKKFKENKLGFKQLSEEYLKKYISGFSSLNKRNSEEGNSNFKYERICLLIADFSKHQPKIYNSVKELINDGFLPKDTNLTLEGLNYNDFLDDLISTYNKRFRHKII
jgi:hypothetical protein